MKFLPVLQAAFLTLSEWEANTDRGGHPMLTIYLLIVIAGVCVWMLAEGESRGVKRKHADEENADDA